MCRCIVLYGEMKMEKETIDKRIEKTKASILNALIALSKEKELNEISIRELTEVAHIHRNTFYLHYTDVDSVLAEVEETMCSVVKEMAEQFTGKELLTHVGTLLQEVFQYLYEEREKCVLMMKGRGKVSSGKMLLESVFEKYLQNFPVEINKDSFEFQAQFYYCTAGALGIIRYWMEHEFQESPKQVANITGKLLLQGIQGIIPVDEGKRY